ncbi:hypothetical protein TELCIR_01555 [Teladorsagia circumcincta]|uniref:Vacuolar sorting protein 39/Transforming growth factor beta receptor-associated domain-containing protein n=1 Tax=Teladorsagia circumcincta TaxID=45464 RepID=A0A2G9V1N5_TELCI|nr:hypothetical protein TELCIR_01555 [Teladorsagia circumcincta]
MALSKASLLCAGNPGYVFISSPFDVWMLDAHANIRKNVSTLISDKQFELAIQVVEMSNFFTEDNKIEIKRQAALNLFQRKRLWEILTWNSYSNMHDGCWIEILQAALRLEHIIYKWDETRPKFHDTLVEHYIINLKLLQQDYEHAFPDAFYEERALVLGRLKHHEQALAIYTSILNDFDAAEEYCKLYYDESDEINSQVYLQLFRAFVSPSDPMIAGVLEKELPTPEPDILDAIRVLSRHASKIDTGDRCVLLTVLPKLKYCG